MAKHGVVILAMVVILLSALAVCTGIFLAIVNYQTSAADRALYELQHLPSIVNGR
jgi:flagellar basal body-associated protein FliL